MPKRLSPPLARAIFAIFWCGALPRASGGPVDFNRDVRPIITGKCLRCHGPDDAARKAGLRLDTRAGALARRGEGKPPAIVPGDAAKSELVRRISAADPDEVMPPPKSGKSLSPAEIDALRRWVAEGARYAEHWAYVKPERPAIPAVKNGSWPRNAIDRFILERLEREGLSPSPEADRYALVRRASLDLTGLPPEPAEVDRFLGDREPDAYERLVDRLLASSAYGEHWARLWLDLARYADSAGYADDPPREIWGYRDWVIRAFNANLPFDRFTLEQIAGDLLPSPTPEQLIATAFHRNTQTNSEGGTDDEEYRNVAVVDRVNTTFAVWMGTTMACAQCHNHKYDPFSQEEYFRFFAILNNTEDADRNDESPRVPFFTEDDARIRARLGAEIAALETKLRMATPELEASRRAWEKSFPLELGWTELQPAGAVEFPLRNSKPRALRIEALPDDALPARGPGRGEGGSFEVSRVQLSIVPPAGGAPSARFVRLELPGKGRILHVAEVQVFHGGENLALGGEAKQSSTDYDSPAQHAIDGKTDGNYAAGSITHTRLSDDPWWEVDLKSTRPIDQVVVWNRTDGALQSRLDGFRLQLLSAERKIVWQSEPQKGPEASLALSTGGERPVPIAVALADPPEGFDGAAFLKGKMKDAAEKTGWSGGGGRPSSLTLVLASAIDAPSDPAGGSLLRVSVEGGGKDGSRRLGRFRLSGTESAGAAEWARTPSGIVRLLALGEARRSPSENAELTRYYLERVAPELEPSRTKLAALRKDLDGVKPSMVPVMRELHEGQRRKTQIQYRGNFLDRGPEVAPGVPAALHHLPQSAAANRMGLARWLVDEKNPLTGRVVANRAWEKIFGIGLVVTSEEFGAQGEPPSHPELLDWLAVEVMEGGWDQKGLLRLLVTSAAYRQSSRVTPEAFERDPDNRLLARGPRFRLPAETIRDQALFASGLLSRKMYGPPVKPPQPSSGLSAAFGGAIDWQTSSGEDKYRRGLYVTWRRSNPYPSMSTFDATNREVCTIRRARTNTPLQALVTLNDPVYVEAAQALARRMALEGGPTAADRARHGFRLSLARPPEEAELARLVKLHDEAAARFAKDPESAMKLATDPLGPLPEKLARDGGAADLAAWTVVANVLLNLDEMFLCR